MKLLLILLASVIVLSSCSTMEADGGLKQLADGELFSGDPGKPTPADNTMVRSTDESNVGWKMKF